MDEFKNLENEETVLDNFDVSDQNETSETNDRVVCDISQQEDDYSETAYVYEQPTFQTVKKHRKAINPWVASISSALVICLIMGTVFMFNSGNTISGERNNSILHTSNAAQNNNGLTNVVSQDQFTPTGTELSTSDIAAKVGPAIVGIVSTHTTVNYFFNQKLDSTSSGSGVIVSDDGYIVTNYHVIEGANSAKVILNSGSEYEAQVIGFDSRSDLAVIKIDEKNLPYATFGDSSSVIVGERAIAIGNPLGTDLMGTVTQGIISAVNRSVTVENKTLTVLQTDAAINAGNSGGALINSRGEVIGINTVKMLATGVEGIGFAIPSNEVKIVVDDLINYGYVKGRLVIGVSGQNITEKLSEYYGLPEGFYVNEVAEGYGAYLAGIQPGDVIVKCDGEVTKTIDDINRIRDSHEVGDMIEITVSRNGNTVNLKVKLMEDRESN